MFLIEIFKAIPFWIWIVLACVWVISFYLYLLYLGGFLNMAKIKHFLVSITFQERKKRELAQYKDRVEDLKKLSADEIDLKYINLKSEYEHKKIVLSIFLVAIVLTIIMDIWKYFYIFAERTVQYISEYKGDDAEAAKMVFVIFVSILIFITIIVIMILVTHTRKMYRVHKDLIIIEELRKQNRN